MAATSERREDVPQTALGTKSLIGRPRQTTTTTGDVPVLDGHEACCLNGSLFANREVGSWWRLLATSFSARLSGLAFASFLALALALAFLGALRVTDPVPKNAACSAHAPALGNPDLLGSLFQRQLPSHLVLLRVV